jgi:Fic family protein
MYDATANKLRKIIDNANWSRERLAQALGVSLNTVNRWLKGEIAPRENNIAVIDKLYNDIAGRDDVTDELLKTTEQDALNRHIEVAELITNEELLDKVTLYLTYHTNTIEGSTMTLSDVKAVLDDDNKVLANKTAREQAEARNHRAALYYLFDELNAQGKDFKWNKELILQTHLRLMNTIISNAGMYRNHGVRIMGSPVPLANYARVPDYMDEFIVDLNTKTDDVIGNIAKLHATFEQIHPFSDGNGRTGRLIIFIQALQNEVVPPLIVKERKRAYYKYLEKAQTQEKYKLLRLFIAESIIFADNLTKN